MAKINTASIEGFEAMSAEEQVAALLGLEYDDHTEELDKMKKAVTKANGEAASWKRKAGELEEAGSKGQTESEKRMADLEEQLAAMKKEKQISQYTAEFLAQGYPDELAASTAQSLADGDMAAVFAAGKTFLADREKAMKADILKGTPRPGAAGSGKGMTKEDIMKVRDPLERQKLIGENLETFESEE